MDPIVAEKKTDETICNDMRHLGLSSKFDCKFIVGSDTNNIEIIYGCKYMFIVESPVFEKMILSDSQEAENISQGILLPDDDPKAMRHFRLLACSGDRKSHMEALSLEDTLNLTVFCQKYMALSITKLCTDRLLCLCENADSDDLIKILPVFGYVENPLSEKVIHKLQLLGFPVKETLYDVKLDAFKFYFIILCAFSKHSSAALFTTLAKYLDHNDLMPTTLWDDKDTSEEKIRGINDAALEKPINTKGDGQEDVDIREIVRKFPEDLLKLINFGDIGALEFISGPGASNLLTFEQKYYILSRICRKQKLIRLHDM